ncbi:glycosyltransferase family 2 protein [Enterobacter bugandensis]|uniref:glycosyltransferase family 2 protein n=1 Tax=Enterobacter TaxID=547 RepID=UPI0018683AF7|nr:MULTISPECIES: glycosyltransferase family 2 protein [Enterobacter]EKS7116503.1 glycosyltransferase family 2 protein [Enterobacter bugandensis]ELK6539862.1 glycosyltransferase family 2 protein [Enterobacter bugandensis]MBE3464956.1 glycosyltransferase family 2 protein [Enterobacter cloacae complex sp. P20C]MBE3473182.1 glycosyltransferase family 2 protein [Enterobacter cloacae complex sp. P20B]MBE3477410.1 glycosyltransferase family 2 protein [Enterobacter cloacae complex sp. P13B]
MKTMRKDMKVAVVIPCYKVKKHILDVINNIGNEVAIIYVVDDKCPELSGEYVQQNCIDPRVKVIFNNENKGVGGAVISGYLASLEDNVDIVVKLDGDGQMDPSLIGDFINPISKEFADYTKGNRFYDVESLKPMPKIRLFGNTVLSFMTKFSSGYYNIFDPTNGYTAISSFALKKINLDKLSKRYFFESDILFRLNLINAKVVDVPMDAIYEDEESNLHIKKIVFPFLKGHLKNAIKRIIYNYYLRDFSVASIELFSGLLLSMFGVLYGLFGWYRSIFLNELASGGTVMLSALPIILGMQLLLGFIQADIERQPKNSITELFNK